MLSLIEDLEFSSVVFDVWGLGGDPRLGRKPALSLFRMLFLLVTIQEAMNIGKRQLRLVSFST
jgi:hypothetical protein